MGRYRVQRLIARGGFAYVYEAIEVEGWLRENVALKLPRLTQHPEALMGILEKRYGVWKRLSDARPDLFVRLRALEPINVRGVDTVAVVMDLQAGGTLIDLAEANNELMPTTPAQVSQLIRLFLQACEAVVELHRNGLIHRDIKPGNYLLDASRERCRLADFELLMQLGDVASVWDGQGTLNYFAPECFAGKYDRSSEVFALGASLYHLLTGKLPFGDEPPERRTMPPNPSQINPLIGQDLATLIVRCLETNPEHRPQRVEDLIADIVLLGMVDEATTAPLNLARLLKTHLAPLDVEQLVMDLERRGLRSALTDKDAHSHALLEEYCYTAPPDDVLGESCTTPQLRNLAIKIGLAEESASGGRTREELIRDILRALGFVVSTDTIPGPNTMRNAVIKLQTEIAHAASVEGCIGATLQAFQAIEHVTTLLVDFYGYLLHGSAAKVLLATRLKTNMDKLTFGKKLEALSALCCEAPKFPLSPRIAAVFRWPLFNQGLLNRWREIVNCRNQLAHPKTKFESLRQAGDFGRRALADIELLISEVTSSPYMPGVLRIVARNQDEYGRQFFIGRDDADHLERLFTPLSLQVGSLYLYFPLTDPARINPLIFPLSA